MLKAICCAEMKVEMNKFVHSVDDLSKQVGYSRKDNFVRCLRKQFVEGIDWICPSVEGRTGFNAPYLITDECLRVILATNKGRRSRVPQVAGITVNCINRYIPAETEIIAFLVESFGICYRTSTQYRVGQYRVDLYFHSPSIIVECDEHGHRAYDPSEEEHRTRCISQILPHATWLRFDPYSIDFRLSHLMQDILRILNTTK